ncbi:hypothetical protein KY348_06310 [Candidatus Woesearchaeota archaeon]|nr:hypothetical protein [Candidatus Woesearchaeota archaeon]
MKKFYFFLVIGFVLVAFYPQNNQIFPMNSAENPKLISNIMSPYSQLQLKTLRQRQMLRRNLRPILKSQNNESQHWIRTYGGTRDDLIYSLEQTLDGGFITGGLTWSFGAGETDVVITKLTSEGLVEWQETYGRSSHDGLYYVSVHQTPDGGYIVATDTFPEGSGWLDIWVFKLDSQGNIKWQKTCGNPESSETAFGGIQLTNDGGFVMTGYTATSWAGHDIFVVKLDSQGKDEWQKAYPGPNVEKGNSIHQTPDEGYIVLSSIISPDEDAVATFGLLKLYPNGEIEWQETYPGYERSESFYFYGYVEPTSDGGYFVADFTDKEELGQYDMWFLKLDSKGNPWWQKKIGGLERDVIGRRMQQTNDGKYIVAGYTASFGDSFLDALIFKLGSKGNVEWAKTYGMPGTTEVAFDIQETNDLGYIVGGYRNVDSFDLMAMKIDQNGNIGAGCPFITDVNLTVTDTYAVPMNTAFTSQDKDYPVQNTNVTPESITMDSRLLYWDLNQPPIDITVTTEENYSAFRKETYNIIRWNPNPYNTNFTVTEYRVYRVFFGEYELLETVPYGTFEFWDRLVDETPNYKYAVTTVVDGKESPLPEPVGGN